MQKEGCGQTAEDLANFTIFVPCAVEPNACHVFVRSALFCLFTTSIRRQGPLKQNTKDQMLGLDDPLNSCDPHVTFTAVVFFFLFLVVFRPPLYSLWLEKQGQQNGPKQRIHLQPAPKPSARIESARSLKSSTRRASDVARRGCPKSGRERGEKLAERPARIRDMGEHLFFRSRLLCFQAVNFGWRGAANFAA